MAEVNLGRLIVTVGTNLEELQRGLTKAQTEVEQASQRIDKITKATGKVLTAVGVGITAFAGAAVKAAADQERATARLAEAMRQTGTFTDEALAAQLRFAAGLQQTTTFSDDAITSAQALLVSFGKLSGSELEEATRATVGFAAALGISVEDAAKRVALAIDGTTSGLGRYGVAIDQGATRTERMQAIFSRGGGLFGLAEAQARTFSGRLSQLSNAFNDLQEAIGQPLLAPLQTLVERLTSIVKAANQFAEAHPRLYAGLVTVIAAFGVLSLVVGPLLIALPGLVAGWGLLSAAVGGTVTALAPLAVALGVAVFLLSQNEAAMRGVVVALDILGASVRVFTQLLNLGLITVLRLALEQISLLADGLNLVTFGAIGPLDRFTERLDRMKEKVDGLLVGGIDVLTEELQGLAQAASGEGGFATDLVAQVEALAESLGTTVPEAANRAGEAIRQQGSVISDVLTGATAGVDSFVESAKQRYGDAFGEKGTLANFVQNFSKSAADAVSSGLGNALTSVILRTNSAKEAFKEFGKELVATIVRFVVEYGIQLALAKVLSSVFGAFATGVAALMTSIWSGPAILATIATFGAAAAQAPASVAGALAAGGGVAKAIQGAASGGLAEGGIVTEPTIAALAEKGKPEAVIPLDRLPDFAPRGSTIETMNISVTVNGPKLERDDVEQIAELIGDLTSQRLKRV
jgi:hypothetical protein